VQPDFALSDALWARVATVLAAGDPAPPPNARALMDAIIYRVLTGVSWEALPAAYPAPEHVTACAIRLHV
jgi:transposase